MAEETNQKMMEILRILAEHDDVLGAKIIASELKKKGYNLGERAVRYHMRILDEKGLTERVGYAGRRITEKGLQEINKGLVYDQVNFIFSKFESMIYRTSFNPDTLEGKVVVNTSLISPDSIETLKSIMRNGFCLSPYVRIEENDDKYIIKTICGTTVDGILLKNGIPVIPQFGGIVQFDDHQATAFTDLIAYRKTSMTPLEAFTSKNMTSILDVIREGSGSVPADFRLIPESARDDAIRIFRKLERAGISGLLGVGRGGEDVLGVPVDDGMVGVAIIGGITPLCAIQEAGYDAEIKLAENLIDFRDLSPLVKPEKRLVSSSSTGGIRVRFLLSKAWNLINDVDFNPADGSGKVIANISFLRKDDLDDALEIIGHVLAERPEFSTLPMIRVMDAGKMAGIATVCSLTVDGILIKNGVMSTPRYGGLLETGSREMRFVELTAYSGSSLDPHEIYVSKNMTAVLDAVQGQGRVLASLREVPYLARGHALEVMENLQETGFQILGTGKPGEILYNARVEKYRAGIVNPGGLNPLAAVSEAGIEIEMKAVESLMDLEGFLWADEL
ncbi:MULTISPECIES: DUF128 domain-containing protein [Methanothermobacter]|uniref:DUF128 domain-containing protein n=1 Tax=Methanothermobacter wolfeii TaxID=145261 RepID=A0A9E7RUV7_METWO|nr:DUF128 domain-containing protein [Methanothermobacter wolfeii]UXH31847.1 DUF128 domain-containing protein [Methanothermobacter wolfeii]